MKVLVTGASGFVGSYLLEDLSKKTKYLYGTFNAHRPVNLKTVDFYRCDFGQFQQVCRLLKKLKPTHIFHLVGQSSPSLSWKYPFETMASNLLSTIHLLESCRQIGIQPKILLASSAHVYGETFHHKRCVTEHDEAKPMDPYGSTKLEAETVALQYWQQFHIPVIIIRASAHTGEGQPPVFALSNFAKQIAEIEKGKKKPVLWTGNLKVERGFVAISDMVKAYGLAMKQCESGEIYNIGASKVKSIGEWLELLLQLASIKIQIKLDPDRKRLIEPHRISVDCQKFKKITGWKETVDPADLLRNILDWWRMHV